MLGKSGLARRILRRNAWSSASHASYRTSANPSGGKRQHREGIELPLSEQELAELVSTTPFTVNRILAGWKRQNLVDVGRERIRILDLPSIAQIARR